MKILKKRILAYTLALAIILSSLVFGVSTVSAETTTDYDVWDGETIATDFAGGDGSAATPWLIETAAQLRHMVLNYSTHEASNGKFFKLTKDIYLNDVVDGTHVKSLANKNNWLDASVTNLPATSAANSFSGTFDGDGHTVYGLYVNGAGGLFPAINSYTTVKNLNIENVFIRGGEGNSGALAGIAEYATWQNAANVTNCSVVNATIGQAEDVKYGGGFIGYIESTTINFTNCYATGLNMSVATWVTNNTPGAIVGAGESGGTLRMTNCYTTDYFVTSGGFARTSYAYTNVYTTAALPGNNNDTGVTVLTDDQMKGTAAKDNMTGFDFALTWKTVEGGYPVFSDIEVWDGTASTSLKGSGTAADPYIIENGADLRYMADQVVAYSAIASTTCPYYKIVNDIYLNVVTDADVEAAKAATLVSGYAVPTGWETKNTWRTHSSQSTGFYGVVDGGGHTIYGVFVPNTTYAGLFNNVVGDTKITNLHIEDSYIYGKCAGGFVGSAYEANTNLTLTGCTVNNVAVEGQTSSVRVGGLVGGGESVGSITATNCSVTRSAMKSPYTNYPSIESGLVGYIGKKAAVVKNSFIDDSAHPLSNATNSTHFETNMGAYATYTNVYYIRREADDSRTFLSTSTVEKQFTVLTAEQMKGENAKTYMTGLDFNNVWQTVEGDFPVLRKDPVYPWDGSWVSSHNDFKGSGTKDDPYLIENGAQLYFAAIKNSNLTDGSYYKLVRDIVLNDTSVDGWEATATPWGMNSAKRFNGTLDGNGHTIEGLYINVNSTSGRYGFFSYVGQDTSVSDKVCEIKNITFKGASVTNITTSSFEGVGIVAGQASGETVFENIYIDETSKVNAPSVKGVAGIVARSNQKVTINNCAVHGTYTGGSHVGSFMGTFWGGSQYINNSYSAANVPVTTSRTPTIVNVYATVKTEDNYYDSAVVLLTADQMIGENAKTNMVGFDFDFLWKTVENGYPVLRDMDERLAAWDGSAVTSLEGKGTKETPYKISNGAELYYAISTYSNQAYDTLIENIPYFEITSDINLDGKQWYNVGKTSYPSSSNFVTGFAGVIYGNGHTVYNLSNTASVSVAGLIPVATQGTEIYDLHLVNGNLPKVVWNTYVGGGLIGLAVGTASSTPIVIDGCSVENYTVDSRDGSAAFVGDTYSQSLIIKDCYAVGNAISHSSTAATMNTGAFVGIVDGNGEGNSIVIENSYTDTEADIGYVKEMSTTFKNVYTTLDSYDNSVNGLAKLTAAQLTGSAAKSNLNGFNFNQKWQAVDGAYPVHTAMDYRAGFFTGNAASTFAGGAGTEADPYLVSTADQLYLLANLDRETTLGKFYKLTNNISISNVYSGWANDDPYTWAVKKAYLDGFTYTSSFAGTLDGAGYTVSGLYYNNAIVDGGAYAYGLIPFVTANAVVKDITVSDIDATVRGNGAAVGGVVGAAHVTPEDAENPLNFIQFVGVNVNNFSANAAYEGDILGRATRGVKFEICNAVSIIGNYIDDIFMNGCNEALTLGDDVVIYNALNADATAIQAIRAKLLDANDAYITDINAVDGFDIADLVSAQFNIDADVEDEYELVWSQEFNNNTMDYSVWSKNTTMSQKSNLVYADNATVIGGALKLNTKDTGAVDSDGNKIYSVNYGLSTVDTMSFKYGRLEMRAKIPFGAGAFPSLWLTSRNALGNGKSPYGYDNEIDIFEVFGNSTSQDRMVTCIHKWYVDANGNRIKDENDKNVECSTGTGNGDGNAYKIEEVDRSYVMNSEAEKTAWHTIVFEWTEDTMTFSVDGKIYYTARKNEMDEASALFGMITGFDKTNYDTDNAGIFNQFMYLRVNNHMHTVGGTSYVYGGIESDINPDKLTYEIDYIKLYQKDNGEINLK